MSEKRYANIMLLGRTGVGKSSFINYLIGKEVSETGTGMPVTQGFTTYEFSDVAGIPLRIFDSKGLEVMDYEQIKKGIFDFVQKRCGSADIYEWIHSIFYCINVNSRRVEPEEIEFIKKFSGQISHTVHIIMTHCESSVEGREKSEAMVNHIKSQLKDERIQIYCVNSVETRTRVSTTPSFGRQEVLDQIFELLWFDMAHKVAKEYAKELCSGLERIVLDTIFEPCDNMINKISNIGLISDFIFDKYDTMDQIEKILDRYSEEYDAMIEKIEKKCQATLIPLIEFCKEYGNSLGYEIEFCVYFDSFTVSFLDIDENKIMERSKIGNIVKELEDIENADGFQLIIKAGKVGKKLFSMKKLMKDLYECIKSEAYQSIPSRREIEKSVYDRLIMCFHK